MQTERTQPIGSYPQEDYYGSITSYGDEEEFYNDENPLNEYERSMPDYEYEYERDFF
jgi:hypothetical protein